MTSLTHKISKQPVIEDRRLKADYEKVEAGERLSYEDGVTMYRSGDILALGYMANLVRERKHGDTTYFNVNRHINPDRCVRGQLPFVRIWQASQRSESVHHVARTGLGSGG